VQVAQLGPLPTADAPQADAAVSRLPGTVLSILTADCLPVLFCAADGSEIGAAHAGWRGLAGGVLEATLAELHAPHAQVLAWLGPCIGATSYEVGEEVRAAFVGHDAVATECFVPTRPGHWLCDLAGLARQRLRAAGVAQIHGGGFDTFTDARCYSYRRDGARSGRFASLIWLV
jgi:YfiH family protein